MKRKPPFKEMNTKPDSWVIDRLNVYRTKAAHFVAAIHDSERSVEQRESLALSLYSVFEEQVEAYRAPMYRNMAGDAIANWREALPGSQGKIDEYIAAEAARVEVEKVGIEWQ